MDPNENLSNTSYNIAFPITNNAYRYDLTIADDYGSSGEETHTCTSYDSIIFGCSCCKFVKDKAGRIVGCECCEFG